jgi:hypothetical protein
MGRSSAGRLLALAPPTDLRLAVYLEAGEGELTLPTSSLRYRSDHRSSLLLAARSSSSVKIHQLGTTGVVEDSLTVRQGQLAYQKLRVEVRDR